MKQLRFVLLLLLAISSSVFARDVAPASPRTSTARGASRPIWVVLFNGEVQGMKGSNAFASAYGDHLPGARGINVVIAGLAGVPVSLTTRAAVLDFGDRRRIHDHHIRGIWGDVRKSSNLGADQNVGYRQSPSVATVRSLGCGRRHPLPGILITCARSLLSTER